jgi:hypothetical protein
MVIKNFQSFINEEYVNNLNSLDLLIDLTEFTIPHGHEKLMYNKIQKNCNKTLNRDGFGNLFLKIGDSKILFTAHLDTYCKEVKKINHIIENDFLKTDETTILGGDNRVGCAILINMINNNVPGNYYFFCGEEVGRLGSEYHNSEINENEYSLAITFDRKELGSVCNYQRGVKLANDELVDFLISELNKTGYRFFKDNFGLSCDTYSFNEKVNNCLNISTGVYDEHKVTERVDLKFFDSIFNISTKIDWVKIEELSLSKVRDVIDVSSLNIKDKRISDTLDYFIKNGYNPTKVPKIDEEFGIYKKDLYFKSNPKIFDYFYISIKHNGNIIINGKELTKERVMIYINDYKNCLIEFNIGENSYHIIDIETSNEEWKIKILENKHQFDIFTDEKLQLLDKNKFIPINLFNKLIDITRSVLLFK